MLRLLLRENRHDVKTEYKMRIAIICLQFLIAVMIIWSLVLLSLFLQVDVDHKIASNELERLQASEIVNAQNEHDRLSSLISEKVMALRSDIYYPSEFLNIILDNQKSGISLGGVEIDYVDVLNDQKKKIGIESKIKVRGVSDSRSDLVDFQKLLSEEEVFESVEVPYSSFTASSEIPFDISIKTVELTKYYE
jgi:hypothetical protein